MNPQDFILSVLDTAAGVKFAELMTELAVYKYQNNIDLDLNPDDILKVCSQIPGVKVVEYT